jgi:hypothetical protein
MLIGMILITDPYEIVCCSFVHNYSNILHRIDRNIKRVLEQTCLYLATDCAGYYREHSKHQQTARQSEIETVSPAALNPLLHSTSHVRKKTLHEVLVITAVAAHKFIESSLS